MSKTNAHIFRTMLLAVLAIVGVSKSAVVMPWPQVPPQSAETRSSIEGIVVDLNTRAPISGVEVELVRVEGTASLPLKGLSPVAALPSTPVRTTTIQAGQINSHFTGNEFFSFQAWPLPAGVGEVLPRFTSGPDGKFVFRDLQPGGYRLVAVGGGGAYNPAEYGQRDPRGRGVVFSIVAGQALKDINLVMAPTGVITGRIFNENGEAMGHVTVLGLEPVYMEGRRILNIVEAVHTNEQGDFRLRWLPPGQYYVAARITDPKSTEVPDYVPVPGTSGSYQRAAAPNVISRILPTGTVVEETYLPVYNGSVVDPDKARPIDLGAGQNFSGADVFMKEGKRTAHHIRGTIVDSSGNPRAAEVKATRVQSSSDFLILSGRTDASGAFDMAGATAGSYFVAFGAGGSPSRVEVGDSDVNDLKLALAPQQDMGMSFTGRLSIEGRPSGDNPDYAKMRVRVWNPDTDWISLGFGQQRVASLDLMAAVSANGEFSVKFGLSRGYFRAEVLGMPSNMYVQSIRMGTTDVLADGLQIQGKPEATMEVVIGADAGTVSGSVVNDKLLPLGNTVVALVPARALRSRSDLFRSATTDADGKFTLQAPPGDYTLFAWEYERPDAWRDGEFLQKYEARGQAIHIDPRGKNSVQAAVIPSRR